MIGFVLRFQAKYYIPDASINLLIKFFFVFLSVAGRFSTFMKTLADIFPKSLSTMLSLVKGKVSFTKFVVCRKCHALYDLSICQEKIGSRIQSKSCVHKPFPDHPHCSKRGPCNCVLLKSVEVKSGLSFLYPYKIFCYKSLKLSLEKLFLRPSFYEQCQQWKTRPISVSSASSLNDVYDGAIWKEFQSICLNSFSVGLMLNIDWFQPYTHTISSVGVIYLTLMNLPRHIRSKREHIIIVGIIPGPSEPAHDINTYLTPLVKELLSFWEGVSCDLPAARKNVASCPTVLLWDVQSA